MAQHPVVAIHFSYLVSVVRIVNANTFRSAAVEDRWSMIRHRTMLVERSVYLKHFIESLMSRADEVTEEVVASTLCSYGLAVFRTHNQRIDHVSLSEDYKADTFDYDDGPDDSMETNHAPDSTTTK
ncbi:hypothetical protein F0562_012167 [Nyssa sinensis]|uniref:Uncharacterized protein n=1 Tax=Nyssa sinensis TaxID=561372 RepID=A0A5J4ZRQ6_9ASTE|nr:hypothetical protein F0562_012167 [Nyssa sinensis]